MTTEEMEAKLLQFYRIKLYLLRNMHPIDR